MRTTRPPPPHYPPLASSTPAPKLLSHCCGGCWGKIERAFFNSKMERQEKCCPLTRLKATTRKLTRVTHIRWVVVSVYRIAVRHYCSLPCPQWSAKRTPRKPAAVKPQPHARPAIHRENCYSAAEQPHRELHAAKQPKMPRKFKSTGTKGVSDPFHFGTG